MNRDVMSRYGTGGPGHRALYWIQTLFRNVEVKELLAVLFIVASIWGVMELSGQFDAGIGYDLDMAITGKLFLAEEAFPLDSRSLADFARDVTALGGTWILIILSLSILLYLLFRRDWIAAIFLFIVVVGATTMTLTLKDVFDRDRPTRRTIYTAATNPSFPSGHSFISAALYPALATLIARREKRRSVHVLLLSISLFLVFLVGTSRVLLGAHYPTDVIAGWSLGFAWVFLCRLGLAYVEKRRAVEQQTETEPIDEMKPAPTDPAAPQA